MTPLPPPGSTFGRYRIDEEIGRGGMGVVYLATDTHLNRPVALKVIAAHHTGNPTFVAQFLREAELLARLDSPHITAVYDSGTTEGHPFVASQYVEGGDLARILAERGSLSPETAVAVCAQVAQALQGAHAAGIVHGDVKPSNILVRHVDSERVHAYLCDFGVASTVQEPAAEQGQVAGTWGFLPPERIVGGPATPAGDVYALGCVLWACLHGGEPPYTGSDHAVAHAHVTAPVPRLSGGSGQRRHLDAVLSAALAKDPAERHSSARHFREHLLGAAAPPRRRRRVRPGLVAGAAALVLAGAAAGGYALFGPGPTGPAAPTQAPSVAGDLDGDGFGDAVLVQPHDDGVTVLAYAGDGERLTQTWTAEVDQVMTGDVDADGALEVFSFSPGDGSIEVTALGPDPVEGWDGSVELAPEGLPDLAGRLEDVDGDGDADLLVWANPSRGQGRSELWVAENDGGFETPRRAVELPWAAATHTLLAGDYDGDGRADIAVVRTSGDEPALQLWAGDEDGFDATGKPVPVPEFQSRMTAADVDGSGGEELVSLMETGGAPSQALVRRAEAAGFSDPTLWGLDRVDQTLVNWTLGTTDLDGDGIDDVLSLGPRAPSGERSLRWLRSTGESLEQAAVVGTMPCAEGDCEQLPVPRIID